MTPALSPVPETMLWTLHNRASEAARPDGCLCDPKCLQIYRALDYDYVRHFGVADGSHGVRSQLFDEHVRAFLAEHPDGVVVNLGDGLETQCFRIDNGRALWISVDLPEAMALRERFIAPDARRLHLACSALDSAWFDAVPPGREVFIAAQGLFMYFQGHDVAGLVKRLAARFPGAILMFDYLNRMLSRRSLSPAGWMKTPHYRTPPMPWGIDRDGLVPTFSAWLGQPVQVHHVSFRFPRGVRKWLLPWLEKFPDIRRFFPGVCWLQLPPAADRARQQDAARAAAACA